MARYTSLDYAKYDRIRKAAIRLFYEQGMENVTIAQIAAEAGIAKGTIYLYFPNKEKLIADVRWYCHERSARAGDAGLEELSSACDKLKRRVENMLDWGEAHPDERYVQQLQYAAHSFTYGGRTPLILHYEAQKRIIEEGVQNGEFKDLPVELLGELFNSSASGVFFFMQEYPQYYRDKRILNIALESMVAGLRRNYSCEAATGKMLNEKQEDDNEKTDL